MTDGEHGHGRHLQLSPVLLAVQGKVDEGGRRGIEHHPVLAVDAQAERLVAQRASNVESNLVHEDLVHLILVAVVELEWLNRNLFLAGELQIGK